MLIGKRWRTIKTLSPKNLRISDMINIKEIILNNSKKGLLNQADGEVVTHKL